MVAEQSNRELGIQVDWQSGAGAAPLVRQLEDAIRNAVRSGRLAPGSRLPASRQMCAQLGCSRWVVVQAYEQLVAETFLEAKVGSGTRVSLAAPGTEPSPVETAFRAWRYDFRTGVPDLSMFPRHDWLRAMRSAFNRAPTAMLDYGDPRGLAELRFAVAEYLGRVRGAAVTPEAVTISSGAVQGISIVARLLQTLGISEVAVEHPGWIPLRAPFDGIGVRSVPIRVDGQGLVIDDLEASGARAVLVSPAHSFPVGSPLSAERRAHLLAWADRVDGLIIEDDYDAEFRYDAPPLAPLQSVRPDRVALVGSVSKSLAPALRIGWLIVPTSLIKPLRNVRSSIGNVPDIAVQLSLGEYMANGGFERHLRRMRTVYAARRRVMSTALEESFPGVELQGVPAGLHVMVNLGLSSSTTELATAARRHGIRVYPLSRYAERAAPSLYDVESHVVMGYGSIGQQRIAEGVATLARVARNMA